VEWLKVKALSSSPSTGGEKKKKKDEISLVAPWKMDCVGPGIDQLRSISTV
jgi:hypothetical protein